MRTNRTDAIVSGQLELVLAELVYVRREIYKLRRELFKNREDIMSELDDLKAAMSALVIEAVTDLETVIAKITTPGINPADLVALTQQANDTTAKLRADMAALAGPAPAPAPASSPASPPST